MSGAAARIGPASGARAVLEGARILLRTPRLWPLAAAPVALAAAAFALALWGGVELVGAIDRRYLAEAAWAVGPVRWLALALAYAVAILAGFIVAKSIVLPVAAAPFNELIAERVETIATGVVPPERPLLESLRANLAGAVRGVATALFAVAILLLGLPLLLVPAVGVLLYLAPQAYVEALNALDATFARKGLTLAEKRAWMRRHRGAALGFGGAILLGNMIPLAGLFLVPAAAAGGALLYLEDAPRAAAGRATGGTR